MDIQKLKDRKEQTEKQRDEFVKQAQAHIERYAGAIAVLEELIAEMESEKAAECSN